MRNTWRVHASGRVRKAKKLFRILAVPAYWRGARFGVAAAVEHEPAALDHAYRTVIDVGANRGQFLLVAARRFPEAALFAFEPLPDPRATLQRIVQRGRSLHVFDVALAAVAGSATFHVARADDSSSLLSISADQISIFPGTDEIEQLPVRTARLDEVLRPGDIESPALLKIDVQGGELDVLRGSTGLLAVITTVLVECSFQQLYEGQLLADDVVHFLHVRGFRLHSVGSPLTGPRGRPVQADFVFEREEPPARDHRPA